jgi:hypothetical protein
MNERRILFKRGKVRKMNKKSLIGNISSDDVIKIVGNFVGEVMSGYRRGIQIDYNKDRFHHMMKEDFEVLNPSVDGHEMYSFNKESWEVIVDNDSIVTLRKRK